MIAYLRRVRRAWREEKTARAALDFDTDDREANGGPWEDDDTYVRLNTYAAHASALLLHVVLRRIVEPEYPWPDITDFDGRVAAALRRVTDTERGALLADRWDALHADAKELT